MKLYNLIFTSFIIFFLSLTISSAQKTESVEKDWSIEVGGTKAYYDLSTNWPSEGFGVYVKFEQIYDEHFSFFLSASYLTSISDEYVFKDHYGLEVASYDLNFSFTTITAGENWYILSSDIENDFSPYIGANVLISLSNHIASDTFFYPRTVSSVNSIMCSFAPSAGVNIPIYDKFGFNADAKYVFALFDIEWDEPERFLVNYYTFNLGIVYHL